MYYIGPRTVLELEDFLKNQFQGSEDAPDYETCSLCSTLILSGPKEFCGHLDCASNFHKLCLSEYFETTGKFDCPKCRNDISNK